MSKLDDAVAIKAGVRNRYFAASLANKVSRFSLLRSAAAAGARAGSHVHAIGVGRKSVKGAFTRDTCIRLYVIQKLPVALLSKADLIPEDLDGIPTDVIEAAPAFFQAKKTMPKARKRVRQVACTDRRQQRQRPILGGISTAHHRVTAGTLSCICRSARAGDPADALFALSNNHVFAEVNQAAAGDALYQPGPADGGTDEDRFAELARWVRIELGGAENRVDAALGRILPGAATRREICSIGRLEGTERATEGLFVRKHGRTTGYTEGRVTDVFYDAVVGMDDENAATFVNQIRIERVSPHPAIGLGGDSGSLIVSRDRPLAVGLYFAGPDRGDYGIANHIEDVLRELEITVP